MQREKNDLQSRMEEDQEDMNELMKKHKAAVAQVTLSGTHACQIAIQSLSVIIAHRVDVHVRRGVAILSEVRGTEMLHV